MITIRRKYPVLTYGSFRPILEEDPSIFAYYREDEEYEMLVALNFSPNKNTMALESKIAKRELIRIVSNYRHSPDVEEGQLSLEPWEGIMYKIN